MQTATSIVLRIIAASLYYYISRTHLHGLPFTAVCRVCAVFIWQCLPVFCLPIVVAILQSVFFFVNFDAESKGLVNIIKMPQNEYRFSCRVR